MKLQITLKKSPISSLQVHKDTVAALGLRKVGQTVTKEDNPCIRGQVYRARHMLDVQEIPAQSVDPVQMEEQQGGDPDETARD